MYSKSTGDGGRKPLSFRGGGVETRGHGQNFERMSRDDKDRLNEGPERIEVVLSSTFLRPASRPLLFFLYKNTPPHLFLPVQSDGIFQTARDVFDVFPPPCLREEARD